MERYALFWSAPGYWPAMCLAAACVAVCWFGIRSFVIRRKRRRMEDYRQFVTDTYCRRGERVPALILRYYRREIEAYNEARRGLPFRLLWREEPDGEEFPSPAPERSAAVPPESGERGARAGSGAGNAGEGS
ncbi:hypothetical protein [uncultured Alistipes sp.]|uniref:hypothetical protein n=1 Tax=uncultured Alistipes sp. TaxID=538949 RepID=UPI00266BE3C9|nr:hypothetical protein [uncultured Alistipes sp.]